MENIESVEFFPEIFHVCVVVAVVSHFCYRARCLWRFSFHVQVFVSRALLSFACVLMKNCALSCV